MSKIITLYHGSTEKITKPLFGYGKSDNDYGRGFYCTQNKELAKEWAAQRRKNGYVNVYEIDIQDMKILRLNEAPYTIFHWLNILAENRSVDDLENHEGLDFLSHNYHIDTSGFDIIKGYRADDSYFTFARDFINDGITLQTLSRAMTLGKLGYQMMINSEKAFEKIKFIDAEKVDCHVYYQKFMDRDGVARETYKELRREPKSTGVLLTEIIKMSETRRQKLIRPYKSKSDDSGMGM